MTAKNQNGFSPLFVLLIVLVVGAVGFGAWYVINQKDENTATNQTTQTESVTESEPVSDPSEGGKYLVIKEWGVRFPVSPSIKGDVAYGVTKIKNPSANEDPYVIYIYSKKLAGFNEACGVRIIEDENLSGEFGGKLALSRFKTAELNGVKLTTTDGEYWYHSATSGFSCIDQDANQEAKDYQDFFNKELGDAGFSSHPEKY